MKKTDKKVEAKLIKKLNETCSLALDHVPGFIWLTHFVDYSAFPDSLLIVCVFETDVDLKRALRSQKDEYLQNLIKQKLDDLNIRLYSMEKQIRFDSEESCDVENNGNWIKRYADN